MAEQRPRRFWQIRLATVLFGSALAGMLMWSNTVSRASEPPHGVQILLDGRVSPDDLGSEQRISRQTHGWPVPWKDVLIVNGAERSRTIPSGVAIDFATVMLLIIGACAWLEFRLRGREDR